MSRILSSFLALALLGAPLMARAEGDAAPAAEAKPAGDAAKPAADAKPAKKASTKKASTKKAKAPAAKKTEGKKKPKVKPTTKPAAPAPKS